jgi:hypothetical protein
VYIKPWEHAKVLEIEREEGASETERDCGNKTIHDANAMAQMELLKPLLGFCRITRFKVENRILGKLGSQSPLFSFIAGSQQDLHIHEDRNTENV